MSFDFKAVLSQLDSEMTKLESAKKLTPEEIDKKLDTIRTLIQTLTSDAALPIFRKIYVRSSLENLIYRLTKGPTNSIKDIVAIQELWKKCLKTPALVSLLPGKQIDVPALQEMIHHSMNHGDYDTAILLAKRVPDEKLKNSLFRDIHREFFPQALKDENVFLAFTLTQLLDDQWDRKDKTQSLVQLFAWSLQNEKEKGDTEKVVTACFHIVRAIPDPEVRERNAITLVKLIQSKIPRADLLLNVLPDVPESNRLEILAKCADLPLNEENTKAVIAALKPYAATERATAILNSIYSSAMKERNYVLAMSAALSIGEEHAKATVMENFLSILKKERKYDVLLPTIRLLPKQQYLDEALALINDPYFDVEYYKLLRVWLIEDFPNEFAQPVPISDSNGHFTTLRDRFIDEIFPAVMNKDFQIHAFDLAFALTWIVPQGSEKRVALEKQFLTALLRLKPEQYAANKVNLNVIFNFLTPHRHDDELVPLLKVLFAQKDRNFEHIYQCIWFLSEEKQAPYWRRYIEENEEGFNKLSDATFIVNQILVHVAADFYLAKGNLEKAANVISKPGKTQIYKQILDKLVTATEKDKKESAVSVVSTSTTASAAAMTSSAASAAAMPTVSKSDCLRIVNIIGDLDERERINALLRLESAGIGVDKEIRTLMYHKDSEMAKWNGKALIEYYTNNKIYLEALTFVSLFPDPIRLSQSVKTPTIDTFDELFRKAFRDRHKMKDKNGKTLSTHEGAKICYLILLYIVDKKLKENAITLLKHAISYDKDPNLDVLYDLALLQNDYKQQSKELYELAKHNISRHKFEHLVNYNFSGFSPSQGNELFEIAMRRNFLKAAGIVARHLKDDELLNRVIVRMSRDLMPSPASASTISIDKKELAALSATSEDETAKINIADEIFILIGSLKDKNLQLSHLFEFLLDFINEPSRSQLTSIQNILSLYNFKNEEDVIKDLLSAINSQVINILMSQQQLFPELMQNLEVFVQKDLHSEILLNHIEKMFQLKNEDAISRLVKAIAAHPDRIYAIFNHEKFRNSEFRKEIERRILDAADNDNKQKILVAFQKISKEK